MTTKTLIHESVAALTAQLEDSLLHIYETDTVDPTRDALRLQLMRTAQNEGCWHEPVADRVFYKDELGSARELTLYPPNSVCWVYALTKDWDATLDAVDTPPHVLIALYKGLRSSRRTKEPLMRTLLHQNAPQELLTEILHHGTPDERWWMAHNFSTPAKLREMVLHDLGENFPYTERGEA